VDQEEASKKKSLEAAAAGSKRGGGGGGFSHVRLASRWKLEPGGDDGKEAGANCECDFGPDREAQGPMLLPLGGAAGPRSF